MKSKPILLLFIPLFILLIARSPLAKETTAKHRLTIIYTNDVQGEIEPCG